MKQWCSALLLIFLIVALPFSVLANAGGEQPVTIYYFYDNPCASCDSEGEFLALFNSQVGDIKHLADFTLSLCNTFQQGTGALEQAAGQAGIPAEERTLPLVIAGNRWLRGTRAIEEGLRDLFLQTFDLESAASTPGAALEDTPEPVAEGESPLPPVPEGALYFRYYYTAACSDCLKSAGLLDIAEAATPQLRVDRLLLANSRVDELNRLFALYEVPPEKRQVPILFWQEGYLSGVEEITAGIAAAKEQAHYQGFLEALDTGSGTASLSLSSLPLYLGAGLVGGLNPCGLSMLLLLLSVMAIQKKRTLSIGLTYIAVKGASYFAIGFSLFSAFRMLESKAFRAVSLVVRYGGAALLAGAAALCLLDFYALKRGQYGKVRLQLPAALRRFNHTIITRLGSLQGGWALYLGVALVSAVVSAGEFLCTGQVMLATLMYGVKSGRQAGGILLAAYILAMLAPLTLLVLLASRRIRALSLSETVRKHMPFIKLLTAGVFALFALLILWS